MQLPAQPRRLTTGDKLLTIQEAADQIGVHYQTIRNWIKRGQIEYRKWGQTVRIPLEAINGKEAGQTSKSRGNPVSA